MFLLNHLNIILNFLKKIAYFLLSKICIFLKKIYFFYEKYIEKLYLSSLLIAIIYAIYEMYEAGSFEYIINMVTTDRHTKPQQNFFENVISKNDKTNEIDIEKSLDFFYGVEEFDAYLFLKIIYIIWFIISNYTYTKLEFITPHFDDVTWLDDLLDDLSELLPIQLPLDNISYNFFKIYDESFFEIENIFEFVYKWLDIIFITVGIVLFTAVFYLGMFVKRLYKLVTLTDLSLLDDISEYSIYIDEIVVFLKSNPIFLYFGLLFLLSTLISLILMSYLGLYGVFVFNFIILINFWLSLLIYFNFFFVGGGSFKIIVGKWFDICGYQTVNFELYVDSVSYSFMLLTSTIALFVYAYVYSYFRYDANIERLILFINCFVSSMILLVISGNLFVFFLGWELIGLTSFLLINFWSSRISTLKSAFKAYTFNKFSDVSILISIVAILLITNDTNINTLNNQINFYKNFNIILFGFDINVIEFISFFLISSAFVKSAQFGTHIWLPDSMEAPVPASALIHSATLVSAGVFLLLRFSPIFEISLYAFYIIPIIGSFTAFFGGIGSCYQSDIKRILAYSTISHCGFLMVSYALQVPEYTILYLYVHGFFKAAVFLCAGNIIRFSKNYQDFRKMGLFSKFIPFEFYASFVCLINLCGLPFTLGFYIKHLIMIGLSQGELIFYFIFINIIGGAISGLFYSYRFFSYSFLDIKKAKKNIYDESSQNELNSNFYSNTTLAANLAISALIIVSYCVSLSLFSVFLNKNSIGSGLDIHSIYSTYSLEFSQLNFNLLDNISYFNWLIVILVLLLVFVCWRNFNNFFETINNLIFFAKIIILLYIIIEISLLII